MQDCSYEHCGMEKTRRLCSLQRNDEYTNTKTHKLRSLDVAQLSSKARVTEHTLGGGRRVLKRAELFQAVKQTHERMLLAANSSQG